MDDPSRHFHVAFEPRPSPTQSRGSAENFNHTKELIRTVCTPLRAFRVGAGAGAWVSCIPKPRNLEKALYFGPQQLV